MEPGSSLAGVTTALVIQGANVALLAKALQQQRDIGRMTVQLLQSGGPPSPPRGADEPGKGTLVDVTA
jgi:hypothetical protein